MPALSEPTDLLHTSLGTLAVRLPGATALFRQHKLDFCCHGEQTLAQSCAQRGLDADALRQALEQLPSPAEPAPHVTEPGALIDHILSRYHEVHRQQLPELVRMARRVEAVHRDHPAVPAGLADFLEAMEADLLQHMQKEEQILFPLLRRGGHPMAMGPIGVMQHEHRAHGERLERLEALTGDHTPPAGACNTWQALYAGTRRLTDDLMQHIHLENHLLFPQFVS